jgi:6-phosphofructo-2-kinase/fructose-2,6-biphosphatase 2
MEMERSRRPVLIIGHQAVLRCLIAYLTEIDQDKLPHTEVPMNTVLKITTHAYGTTVEKFSISCE